jgi:hypothetical protein
MIKRLLLTVFLFVNFGNISIGYAKDIEVTGTFIFEGKSYTYRYTSTAETSHSLTLTRNADNETSDAYVFETFEFDIFKSGFKEKLSAIVPSYKETTHGAKIPSKAAEAFYSIQARKELLDDEPVTARIIVKSDFIASFLSYNSSLYYQGPLSSLLVEHKLKDLEVEFDQGTIKNVTLRLEPVKKADLRNYLIFTNRFPFTVSSKFDNETLSTMRLFCNNCGGVEGITRFVNLGSFLILDYKYENGKEDYSPADGTITLDPQQPSKELKKEKRSRILEVAAYTDFMGIKESNPNGLVQIEVSRKINLWTKHFNRASKRRDLSSYLDFGKIKSDIPLVKKTGKNTGVYKITFRGNYQDTTGKFKSIPEDKEDTSSAAENKENFDVLVAEGVTKNVSIYKQEVNNPKTVPDAKTGFYEIKTRKFSKTYFNILGNVEPKFKFSKIEENERNLSYAAGDTLGGKVTLNALDFYRYQKISLGADLSVFKVNFTSLKLSINLNTGITWFKTGLTSASNEQDVRDIDGFNYNFNGSIKFLPDSRWGASLGYEYLKNYIMKESLAFSNNNELLQYKFDGFFKTNDTDKLFFRFRLTHQLGNTNNVFSQVQLGYSMNIFGLAKK